MKSLYVSASQYNLQYLKYKSQLPDGTGKHLPCKGDIMSRLDWPTLKAASWNNRWGVYKNSLENTYCIDMNQYYKA